MTSSFCMVNIMVADNLTSQGAKMSATNLLSELFRNFSISKPEGWKGPRFFTKYNELERHEGFSWRDMCEIM